MPDWLIGKLLAPVVMLAVVALVTRPASRWVARAMREGKWKKILLADKDRDQNTYMTGFALAITALAAWCWFVDAFMGP